MSSKILLFSFLAGVATSVLASECMLAILNKTQSCENKNILYVPTLGVGSGLGSEFNFYLIYSLIHAMAYKQRLVFVKTGRRWEYDCPEINGWACYLDFPCNDSVIKSNEINLSNEQNSLLDKDSISRDPRDVSLLLGEAYKDLFGVDAICDIEKDNPTVMTSIAAKHLYRLNKNISSFIEAFNSRYGIIDSKYLAVQVRLDDKKYEMSPDCWAWMTNTANIFDLIRPKLEEFKVIFVSTDNCTIVSELATMVPNDVRISSPCFTTPSDATSELYKNLVGNVNPRKPGDYMSTLRVFADIDMLVHGEYFYGLMVSNFVRMIHRLRYPVADKTIPLAQQFTDVDFRARLDGLES